MPYWLLTSTTYGTWLPGDPRGSVTSVREVRQGEAASPSRREHSAFGEAFEPENRGLRQSSQQRLVGEPVWLSKAQAAVVVRQFVETAAYRDWKLLAAAVMANHFHVVLGVREDADGRKLLTNLKAYASRALNGEFGEPTSGRWWTSGGSRRRLFDENALANATHYVLARQHNPLALWPTENLKTPSDREPEP